MNTGEAILNGIVLAILVLVTFFAGIEAFNDQHSAGAGALAGGGLIAIAILLHANMTVAATDRAKNANTNDQETGD